MSTTLDIVKIKYECSKVGIVYLQSKSGNLNKIIQINF